jgi:hypothetical protein
MDKHTQWTINPEWEQLGPECDIPPFIVPDPIKLERRPNYALALLMLGCIGFWSLIAALTIWIY